MVRPVYVGSSRERTNRFPLARGQHDILRQLSPAMMNPRHRPQFGRGTACDDNRIGGGSAVADRAKSGHGS